MSRYFIRPRADTDGYWPEPLLPQLNVAEHVPANTGLVDKNGNPIMRRPIEVGFHRPGKP